MSRLTPLALIGGLVLAFTCLSSAAQDKAPTVTLTPLKGALHLLQGRGGNVVASVGEDGILLVDDDYGEYAQAYHDALVQLAGPGLEPAFVFNTHWHSDHTGSNAFWAERGAVIMAHRNVRVRMSTRQEMKTIGRVVEPSPKQALPIVTFDDSLVIHFNGEDIEVQHYPTGHTDGDGVVYYSTENVVHMGDLFFKDRFPFVDIGSGGDVQGYIAAVASILARVDDSTVIVPGHGSLADKADLERYHRMLTTTSAQVLKSLDQGMSVEAITSRGLGEQWASWGGGFINEARWISFIAAGHVAKPQ